MSLLAFSSKKYIDLNHFSTTSAVFCIKITKNVRKKDIVKV